MSEKTSREMMAHKAKEEALKLIFILMETNDLLSEDVVKAINEKEKQISVVWSIENVIDQSKQSITDEQAYQILLQAKNNHDPDVGINLDVLSTHIDHYLDQASDSDTVSLSL